MNDIDFKTLQHQIELFTFELRRLQDLHIKETLPITGTAQFAVSELSDLLAESMED